MKGNMKIMEYYIEIMENYFEVNRENALNAHQDIIDLLRERNRVDRVQ